MFDIPNYHRNLPPLKGGHFKRVVRNIKLPRHSTYIGYIWVKSVGKWLRPEIPSAILVKGIKIAHAIMVYEHPEEHRDQVLYRLWEGRAPLQLPPPKPPDSSDTDTTYDGEWN